MKGLCNHNNKSPGPVGLVGGVGSGRELSGGDGGDGVPDQSGLNVHAGTCQEESPPLRSPSFAGASDYYEHQ